MINSTPILKQITLLRINEWLFKIWSPFLTKQCLEIHKRKTKNFTIITQLYEIYKNNITIDNLNSELKSNLYSKLNSIFEFLPTKPNILTINSLKNNKILFIEQLLTANNQNLLPWKNIYLRIKKSPRGHIPQ
jgi:hypothetical protein